MDPNKFNASVLELTRQVGNVDSGFDSMTKVISDIVGTPFDMVNKTVDYMNEGLRGLGVPEIPYNHVLGRDQFRNALASAGIIENAQTPHDLQGKPERFFRQGNAELVGTAALPFIIAEAPDLYDHFVHDKPIDLEKSPHLLTAMDIVKYASDVSGMSHLYIDAPMDEEIAGIVLSAAAGIPAGTASASVRAAEKVPVVKSVIGNVRNVIQSSPKAARSTMAVLAKTAEVATPVTLPLTKTNVGLNAAGGVVVNDLLRAVGGQDSISGEVFGIGDAQAAEEAPGAPNYDEITKQLADEVTTDPYEDSPFDWLQQAADFAENHPIETLLGTLGLLVGARALKGVISDRPIRGSESVEFGPNPKPSIEGITTTSEKILSKNLDSTYVLQSQAKRAGGSLFSDEFAAEMETMTRLGGAAAAKEALSTGFMPGSSRVRIPSMRDIQEMRGKLSPEQSQKLADGLVARDALDSREKIFRTNPNAFDPRPSAVDISTPDLRAKVQEMEADPVLKDIADQMKRISHGMLDYLQEQRILTPDVAQTWHRERPNYIPNVRDPLSGLKGVPRRVEQWKAWAKSVLGDDSSYEKVMKDVEHLLRRNEETGTGVSTYADPIDAMEQYVAGISLFAQRNHVRRRFVNQMITGAETQGSLRRVAPPNSPSRLPKAHNQDAVVSFREDGVTKYYEFADPFLKDALDFSPYVAHGVFEKALSISRRIVQQGTTGLANPMFAVGKAWIWDTQFGAATRAPGTKFGYIDAAAQFLTGGKVGLPGDPTAAIASITGMGRDLAAQSLDAASVAIYRNLASQNSFMKASAHTLKPVADAMRRQYLKSTRSMLHRYGGYNEGFMTDPVGTYNSLIRDITPVYSGSGNIPVLTSTFNFYKALMNSIHNGARVGYFAQNYKPGMSEAQLRKLVERTKNLSGNFAKTGSGATYRHLAESVPYLNVTAQATAHYVRAAKANPVSVTMGTFTAGFMPIAVGAYLMNTASEEHADYYANRVPAWKRATHAIIPMSDGDGGWLPPEQSIELPIAPEFIPVVQIAMSGFNEMFGIRDGSIRTDELTDVREAFENLVGLMPPPLVQGALGAMGKRLDTGKLMTGQFDEALQNLGGTRQEGLTNMEHKYIGSDIPINVRAALVGLFGTAMDIVLEGYDAETMAQDQGVNPTQAVAQQTLFEAARRVGIAKPLFNAHVEPSNTPVAEEYYEKVKAIDKIIEEADVGRKGLAGGAPYLSAPGGVRPEADQKLFQVTQDARLMFTRGAFRVYREHYNRLRQQREQVESNRARDPWERQKAVNDIKLREQEVLRSLVDIIHQFEATEGVDLNEIR